MNSAFILSAMCHQPQWGHRQFQGERILLKGVFRILLLLLKGLTGICLLTASISWCQFHSLESQNEHTVLFLSEPPVFASPCLFVSFFACGLFVPPCIFLLFVGMPIPFLSIFSRSFPHFHFS